jgi:hypothetical protein
MTTQDEVGDLIEQFTLAQGELLKDKPDPPRNLCSLVVLALASATFFASVPEGG